jgi:hypothetical protein
MAKPLVIPAEPVARTGSVTYNSSYTRTIEMYTRDTNVSIVQYGKLVTGMVEFQIKDNLTTAGDYRLFTISGVSLPAATTGASFVNLEDYPVYSMIFPAVKINTNGEAIMNIKSDKVNGHSIYAVYFTYISA